ncbi:MAG: hypothetical protein ACXWDO_03940 [Bacteroidia bacterium]
MPEPTVQAGKNNEFELVSASDWTIINQQGIDSYVGYYQKGTQKISFDFGRFAFESIDSIKNTSEMLYFEETVINGCDAKIFKEKTTDGIRLSAFIDKRDGEHMTWLYTFYSQDDQTIISIFKSHKFK